MQTDALPIRRRPARALFRGRDPRDRGSRKTNQRPEPTGLFAAPDRLAMDLPSETIPARWTSVRMRVKALIMGWQAAARRRCRTTRPMCVALCSGSATSTMWHRGASRLLVNGSDCGTGSRTAGSGQALGTDALLLRQRGGTCARSVTQRLMATWRIGERRHGSPPASRQSGGLPEPGMSAGQCRRVGQASD